MALLRTVKCDICKEVYTEKVYNEGFMGWGTINGAWNKISKDAVTWLCPEHLKKVITILNDLEEKEGSN